MNVLTLLWRLHTFLLSFAESLTIILNTGPIYYVSMEKAPSAAVWPGDELPIPMIHVNFQPFGSKSVHP